MINVVKLEKHFGGENVLNGISTEINKGDVVCVIGPSGSGKSTFLRCLNMLEKPTGGKIIFEGDDLTDKHIDLNAHRQKTVGPYIVDFYIAKSKLVIELDGSQHYEAAGMLRDSIRTEKMEGRGLTVIRIPNSAVRQNFRGVCEYLDAIIMEGVNSD